MGLAGDIKAFFQMKKAIKLYGVYYRNQRKVLRSVLYYYKVKRNYNIAIWGAGLKGKAFLQINDPDRRYVKYAYDIDVSKFGSILPTGHRVVNYADKSRQDVDVVLLMNNNYETETAGLLAEEKLDVILVNVDSILAGELTAREVIALHRKEHR